MGRKNPNYPPPRNHIFRRLTHRLLYVLISRQHRPRFTKARPPQQRTQRPDRTSTPGPTCPAGPSRAPPALRRSVRGGQRPRLPCSSRPTLASRAAGGWPSTLPAPPNKGETQTREMNTACVETNVKQTERRTTYGEVAVLRLGAGQEADEEEHVLDARPRARAEVREHRVRLYHSSSASAHPPPRIQRHKT